MKKLLVLALVLSVASLASATLTLSMDSTNGGTASLNGLDLVSDGSLAVSAAASTATQGYDIKITLTGDLALVTSGVSFPGAGSFTAWYFGNGFLGTPTATQARFSGGAIAPVAIGTVAFSGLVITGTTGTISLDEIVDGGAHALSTINVVPEPMTMGLLALGGLFIRRKK